MKPPPPLLGGAPVVGHALEIRRDRDALFRRGLATLGPVFVATMLGFCARQHLCKDVHK